METAKIKTHKCNWTIFSSDKTGGLVYCSGCRQFYFLEPKELRKFRRYKKNKFKFTLEPIKK